MGVRNIRTADEALDFIRCLRTAFLANREVPPEAADWALERWDLDRTWGAFDDYGLHGTTRTFASTLRLPGLAEVPVSCLTGVTVLPTHTRRGALTDLMRAQLEAAAGAGEVASLLVAAEWPIYGRFGYGPATERVHWAIDARRAEVLGEPVGRCELIEDPTRFADLVAEVHTRQQATTPGSIARPRAFLDQIAGADVRPGDDRHPTRARVVHRDPDGRPDAFAMYDVKERWDGMRPVGTMDVEDRGAASAVAERELWRYLLTVDLIGTVHGDGSPGDVLPFVLRDGRAAEQNGRWDHIWARILDVPAALEARAYALDGRLVLDVLDSFLDLGGRFELSVASGRARCVPTRDEPDVTLPTSALGAAWLGGTDIRALAPGWGAHEHRHGALDELGALLRWHQPPWCSTDF